MANEYLRFLFDNPPLPPDTGEKNEMPLKAFMDFFSLDKYSNAPDIFRKGELERLLQRSVDDANPPAFTPSWEREKDPFWKFFSSITSPWELERKFLGIPQRDRPSDNY